MTPMEAPKKLIEILATMPPTHPTAPAGVLNHGF